MVVTYSAATGRPKVGVLRLVTMSAEEFKAAFPRSIAA